MFYNQRMTIISGLTENYEVLLLVTGGVSIFLFVATLLLLPLVVRFIRYDYFLNPGMKKQQRSALKRVLYILWHIVKNIMGVIFIITGIILLFVPGQGVLTILIGLVLLDFPGRDKLIAKITGNPRIRRGLNWIRKKTGKEAFLFKGEED